MTRTLSLAQVQHLLQVYHDSHSSDRSLATVFNLTLLTSGWSNEIYSFDVCVGDGATKPCILRLYFGRRAGEHAVHEFQLMQRLIGLGYPVPQCYSIESSPIPFGVPFIIMERVKGRDFWSALSAASDDRKQTLRTLFCKLFVRLHQLDPVTSGLADAVPAEPYPFADEYLQNQEAALREFGLFDLSPYLSWLKERREFVPCYRPSFIHTDFHYNNVLIDDEDIAIVIDWSGARIADARFDMGWMLMLQRTHIDLNERDLLFREYLRLSNTPMPQIEWFEIYAAFWRVRHTLALLTCGPDAIGAHASARELAIQQSQPLLRTYEFLAEATSIRIKTAEETLLCLARESE